MSENNDNSSDSNSRSGDSILQSSRLVSNPILRSGVLRPSVLGSSLNTIASAVDGTLKEDSKEVVSNPFLKEQKNAIQGKPTDNADDGGGDTKAKTLAEASKDDDYDEPDERPDPLNLLTKNGIERSNLFAAAKNSIPRVEKSGFVFGQNVHERVVGENVLNESSTSNKGKSDSAVENSCLLFSNVIENAAAAKSSEIESGTAAEPKETDAKSLTDVAREYEESRAQKRKFEEVETFTGEENEVNIVDVSCKLFAFVNSNWEERGRGSLRLNDSKNESECSRVVFRTSGNLRLLVNTKLWAGMIAERPSQKSLRLTAMDNAGQIKIFLLMARPVDINVLYKALVDRIFVRKLSHPEECGAPAASGETKNGTLSESQIEKHPADELDSQESEVDSGEPSPKK